jgi:hypothetical protein
MTATPETLITPTDRALKTPDPAVSDALINASRAMLENLAGTQAHQQAGARSGRGGRRSVKRCDWPKAMP